MLAPMMIPTRPPVIGIVGAGQLARMTYQAAIPLGAHIRLLAERADDAAALVARDVMVGSPRSAADLSAFAAGCDVVTFDHELVDAATRARLEQEGHVARPSAATLALAQDKLRQRDTMAAAGFPVPAFRPIPDVADLLCFGEAQGWPVVAKAARGGYDGRGVWVVDGPEAARDLMASTVGAELLAESWVAIEREIAVLVARRPAGEIVVYPVVETVQRDGICHELLAPAPVPPAIAGRAGELARRMAKEIDLVGVMALELFVTGDQVLINEIAARPHNSGHYSIEGCVTSQFEQHLRAVLDWPLGATTLTAPAVATVNVLGGPDGHDPLTYLPAALAMGGAHVHLYGKTVRPGRKLGHVTALGETIGQARTRARVAAAMLAGAKWREVNR
jgi:5-(carboxyamino)imidazole ribonucleotide synthase